MSEMVFCVSDRPGIISTQFNDTEQVIKSSEESSRSEFDMILTDKASEAERLSEPKLWSPAEMKSPGFFPLPLLGLILPQILTALEGLEYEIGSRQKTTQRKIQKPLKLGSHNLSQVLPGI